MKPQRAYCFLVVLLLLLSFKTFSQQQMPVCGQKMPHIPQSFSAFQTKNFKTIGFSQNLLEDKNPFFRNNFLPQISPDFYISHLGVFCRKELQFEKTTFVPLRFRLGSLEYVNKMEGKENHLQEDPR